MCCPQSDVLIVAWLSLKWTFERSNHIKQQYGILFIYRPHPKARFVHWPRFHTCILNDQLPQTIYHILHNLHIPTFKGMLTNGVTSCVTPQHGCLEGTSQSNQEEVLFYWHLPTSGLDQPWLILAMHQVFTNKSTGVIRKQTTVYMSIQTACQHCKIFCWTNTQRPCLYGKPYILSDKTILHLVALGGWYLVV